MRLVSVESDTIRPLQTAAIRSSLLTTAVTVLHQINQQIEYLRLDGNRLGAAPAARGGPYQAYDYQRKNCTLPSKWRRAGGRK